MESNYASMYILLRRFNLTGLEIRAGISNNIPYRIVDVIISPCSNLKLVFVDKTNPSDETKPLPVAWILWQQPGIPIIKCM